MSRWSALPSRCRFQQHEGENRERQARRAIWNLLTPVRTRGLVDRRQDEIVGERIDAHGLRMFLTMRIAGGTDAHHVLYAVLFVQGRGARIGEAGLRWCPLEGELLLGERGDFRRTGPLERGFSV